MSVVSLLVKCLSLQFHPSYPSVSALVNDVLDDAMSEKDIMHTRTGLFEPQLQQIMSSLPDWKAERPHGPKAVLSTHDTAALTSKPTHAIAAVADQCLSAQLAIRRAL